MNLINCYGFSVDSQTMRVYLTEGKVASLSEGVPQGPDGVTKGSTKGEVVQKLAKVVTNSDNNLLYVDIAGEPYKGVIKNWGFLPHTEDGHLLMDSKGEIKSNYKGLSFTNNGGVALTPKSRPDPIKGRPLTGGEFYEDDVYEYALFYSTATTGYEALRTEDGRYTTFEVLLIGAGGGGKGQTVTFGKGGDGGGGQLFVGELPPAAPGSVFVTVPAGGTNSTDTPANTTVKEGATVLTAVAGKTANDKNDGAGYPKQKVPESWSNLRMFTWLLPGSDEVGGVSQSYEQNYPNSTFAGEGGAGTKDNRPGKGGVSYVAIRWKK